VDPVRNSPQLALSGVIQRMSYAAKLQKTIEIEKIAAQVKFGDENALLSILYKDP
jgi:hypothetical protein